MSTRAMRRKEGLVIRPLSYMCTRGRKLPAPDAIPMWCIISMTEMREGQETVILPAIIPMRIAAMRIRSVRSAIPKGR